MAQIQVMINDEAVVLEAGATVEAMLSYLHMDAEKIAVERNLEIIPAPEFSSTVLSEGDKIEIVHFIGGG